MMAISGSLQVYPDVGIGKNHPYSNQFKSVVRSSTLFHLHFSSHVLRRDTLTLRLSDRVHRPISSVPSRYTNFICRCSLIPTQANTTPILKSAAVTVLRSFDTVRGSPLSVQLVPAVGIIVFAVWGMGPLMRHCRNLFLHEWRSDSNWKKSSTHYVMSSYLQPLLLWTGATLVCRALDPVILPSEVSQVVKQRLLTFVRSLSTVLAFAYCLSSLIQHTQKFFMEANDSNDTRNMGFQFAGKAVYTAVWVAAVSLFMELLGFSTQKWLTAGGLGTVLLTLAGREIFTNFLSSAMIHATRPFIVNEWIQTKIEGYEVSGTVEHVGWWSPTIIRGEDREAVHIPNHKFTVNVVRNLTQKTHWRIKTHLAISHLDVNKINNIVADMRKVLAKNPQVEQQKLHRRVFLDNINPENQSLLILISCFVKTSHYEEYLCVKEAILLDLLRVISHHRARLATPIRTVHKVYTDADMEDIYSPPRDVNIRRLLLNEPSYRVNGDDKPKAQPRSVRKNEEPDAKPKADVKVPEKQSDSKAQIKATTTSPNLNSDPEISTASTSDSKVDAKVATSSSSDATMEDANDAMKSTSNVKGPSPVLDSSVQKIKQSKKVDSGDQQPQKSRKLDTVSTKTSASANSLGVKTGVPAAKSHEKQESDKFQVTPPPSSRPALEDNIVLGVALEGSKRTLPIEEGMTPSILNNEEAKELAAASYAHNGNGPSSGGGKNKKDGQISSTVPGVPAGDQREQER